MTIHPTHPTHPTHPSQPSCVAAAGRSARVPGRWNASLTAHPAPLADSDHAQLPMFDEPADAAAVLAQTAERNGFSWPLRFPEASDASDDDAGVDDDDPDDTDTVAAVRQPPPPVHDAFLVFSGLGLNLAPAAARDDDTTRRLRETLRLLRASGPMRPLQPPVHDWRARLDRLEQDFPNFSAVIRTIVRPHLSLLSQNRLHRMVPTLLVGDPGVGKTQFARELQDIFNVPSLFLMMAGETNGAGLNGSSTFWSNSSPGQLFEAVAWSSGRAPVANPLVIIDEVDKARSHTYDPLAALYGLLEVQTAARFQDQAVPGVFLDLTNVRFLLTANDEQVIPAPLRSRVRTFHIELPDAAGMKRIAQKMYASLLDKYKLVLNPALPTDVLDEILALGPRESSMRLEAALAIAASTDQRELNLAAWRLTEAGTGGAGRRMGFL